jgi:hypothetical protein
LIFVVLSLAQAGGPRSGFNLDVGMTRRQGESMGGVFINYRGADSQTVAALIDRELAARFGSDQVFLDCRSIPAGSDFVEELLGRVRTCSVLLVVIGPHWLTLTNAAGQRRIDDPQDWLRREIVGGIHSRAARDSGAD